MERLSGLDASFLYLETPSNHMHVAATMVYDPSTVPGGYDFEKVKEMVRSRLHLVQQFRRRLVTVPFQLHHPVWVEDPDFDLDYHVRRVAVPSPGGPEQLAGIAGDIASRPLDRSRPLWELWVVEGLEQGHIAVVAKMHHCTIDGVSGANLMVHLFDLSADGDVKPAPDEQWEPERVPSPPELTGYAINSRVRRPLQMASILPKTIRAIVNVVQTRRGSDSPAGGTPFTAPRTSFNGAITGRRACAYARVPLDDVKQVKNAFGTTVNDVVLAVCAGALRRFLIKGNELPDKPLLAVVPVSVRTDDEQDVVGSNSDVVGSNRVSAMFTSLPTDISDPVERLYAIRESTKGAKEEHNAVGAEMLQQWSEFAAPNTFSLAMRLYSRMKLADRHPPIHNIVISNVPGPQFPLYFAGAKLVGMYPLGPVFEGAALNVTVLSYMDSMDFGIMACADTVPRVWDLAGDMGEALQELKKAAEAAAS